MLEYQIPNSLALKTPNLLMLSKMCQKHETIKTAAYFCKTLCTGKLIYCCDVNVFYKHTLKYKIIIFPELLPFCLISTRSGEL